MNPSRFLSSFTLVMTIVTLAGCGGARQAALPAGAESPEVVAVIDNELLTLSEFEDRYARSSGGRDSAANDSMGAYVDFLERYVNFRLKVLAAREAGLDKDPEVLEEIETYRKNLARPYLIDREVIDPLVRQMYDRQAELIDASHILIRVAPDAPPADTLAAYEKLQAIRDSIVAGENFAQMAVRHSEDPSAGRPGGPGYEGRLGYFTSGRMVDEFEEAAYATPVGEVSPIFRTNFGYHILRVEERRDNPPARQVAHIMVVPSSDSADAMSAVADTIAFIQDQLAAGVSFEELAAKHSDDRRSAAQGGQLPPISYQNRLPRSFLDAAYALENVGDVSEPVETEYGLHLIKLLDAGARPTYDEAYEELKRTVARLPRAQRGEEAFALELWQGYGGTVDTAAVLDATAGFEIDSLLALAADERLPEQVAAVAAAHLGDSTYTVGDFLAFASESGLRQDTDRRQAFREALERFATDVAIAYETAALEGRNPEFARVMTEFREGLILFSLMEDSVWTAAAEDSLALQAHYDAHREDYRFPERTRVIAFYSASDSVLNEAATRLDEGKSGAEVRSWFLADSTAAARIDTVRIAEETSSVFDQALALEQGEHVGPIRQNREWVLLLNDGVEAPRLKTFEEARATVVSEYQEVLEAELVERLRERYDVHLFPERLQAAFANASEPVESVSATP